MFGKNSVQTEPTIELGVIGHPEAGKSVLFLSSHFALREFSTSSELMFGPKDAAQHLDFNSKVDASIVTMRKTRLASTVAEELFEYCLYEGSSKLAVLKMPDIIGQVLTTVPNSAESEKKYKNYIQQLSRSNVFWVVVPISTEDDEVKFKKSLSDIIAFLRNSLSGRDVSCSVALVLSRIDTAYSSETEAKAALTTDVLMEGLKPLVVAIRQFQQVKEAALFPTSSFGFGNSVRIEQAVDNGEVSYLLKPDGYLNPYNVRSLLVWSLMTGLLSVPHNTIGKISRKELCSRLIQDVISLNEWVVPIKGEWSNLLAVAPTTPKTK